jgi:hypothetical protein
MLAEDNSGIKKERNRAVAKVAHLCFWVEKPLPQRTQRNTKGGSPESRVIARNRRDRQKQIPHCVRNDNS